MKGSKSPDNTEITPSKKKLKQARLPFMILGEVSPKTTHPRKRKLSDPQEETASKVGKISKENNADDSIVISDDDCKISPDASTEEKTMNPFVKLVDNAYKKKLQKSKTPKKKKGTKKNGKKTDHISSEKEARVNTTSSDVESMEVDEVAKDVNGINVDQDEESSEPGKTETQKVNSSIVIEDSNEPTESEAVISSPLKTSNTTEVDSIPEKKQETEDEPQKSEDTAIPPPPVSVTPKRASLRNRTKVEKDKLNSSTSSKLDESVSSTPSTPKTPKQNRSLVNGQDGNESLNNSNNVTPKQAQKQIESAKKKEEREKERIEKEKKKQQEKEERAKQKQEKEEQRKKEKEEKEAAKRKEREEKEEQRKKEKEEKEKQKELEKKLREEKEEQKRKEREEKEEQKKKEKEAREEEKKKKLEAMEFEKQEQELKKKKAAEAFVNFFVPKQKTDKEATTIESSKNCMLSTFAIKSDMRLAPTTRNSISESDKKELENYIVKQNVSETKLYLKNLKNGESKPHTSGKTWPLDDKDDDVVIIEDELPPMDIAGEMITCEPAAREKLRPKLFSFHENRRPPYWGTWRKKSCSIKPRRPFGQDGKQLDYEVDSDDDWEEEAEGESLDGSVAGSDEEQDNDEYEVDNEVFVPHGYLSDEEATMDEDDVLSLSPEAQKQKLKHLEEEFEFELKKPTEKLKPRLYGLLWETDEGGKPENCVDTLWNYFGKMAMIMNDPTPFLQPSESTEDVEKKKVKKKKTKSEKKEGEDTTSPKVDKKKKPENKESKKKTPKQIVEKKTEVQKKNQPGINSFLTKLKPAT